MWGFLAIEWRISSNCENGGIDPKHEEDLLYIALFMNSLAGYMMVLQCSLMTQ